MRFFLNCVLLGPFVAFTAITLSAQEKTNQTLLWRIEKRGMDKPSFLFGTMHVSDKKAFNFRDSLYIYLEQAEAFALEFNPDSANQVIADHLNGEYEVSTGDDDWSDNIEAGDLEKIKRVADKDTKASAFKENKRGLIGYFVERLLNNEKKQKESMNTFMDAFLYEMAWRNGKKIFGLEVIEDKQKVVTALSKGLKVKEANSLLDNWDPSSDESPLNRLYLKEDIDSIDYFFNDFFHESALDIFLYERNREMAHTMDTIMRNHSLFAAVGTGHLPGAKGIIALLRQKGYSVSPVVSQKRIPATEYTFKDIKRNWQLVKNEEFGFQYQLPGIVKTQQGANGRKMVFHYDIGGGSLFMTIYGKLSPSESKKNVNDIVTSHLDETVRSYGGTVLSKKIITYEGLKGVEVLFFYRGNSYARYRELVRDNIFYIFMIESEKKDNLNTEKAEQFLTSFRSLPIPKPNWSSLSFPQDGFSIALPGKPVVEKLPVSKENAGTIAMNYYSWFDAGNGITYDVTLTKTLAGHYYPESDDFFNSYIDYIREAAGDEPVVTDTLINTYAGKNFVTKSADNRMKGMIVKRGNVVYLIIAEYEPTAKNANEVDKFLQSFAITPFVQPQWKMVQSPGHNFSAWLPESITQKERDSTAYDFRTDLVQYYGHDPFASIEYSIDVYSINKFYWAENLDSIYNHWKEKLTSWNDSVMSYSTIKIGGLEGRELWLNEKSYKRKRRYGMLLNGDTMYVLACTPPVAYADEKNTNRFFQDFHVSKQESPDIILKNTPGKLFTALQSTDSAGFQQAYNALDEVSFATKDIMLLLEKAVLSYPNNENNYQTVNDKLLLKLENLLATDSSTATRERVSNFIYNSYPQQNTTIDSLRFRLLGILALDKTEKSFRAIKELLALKMDKADYNYRLFGKLYDSLTLTQTLYPGLLNYISDTTMTFAVAGLTRTMLDSNVLTPDILVPVKPAIVKLAKESLKNMNKEDYSETYNLPELLALLAYYKQKDTDDLVAGFLKAKDVFVKKAAAMALLKNNRSVAASVMRAIAGDNLYRIELYDELHKLGKEKFFPSDFRSQVGLAEGYIVNAIYDEYEDETRPEMIFIKKMNYRYKGDNKVFYIFRANYEYPFEEDEIADTTVQLSTINLSPPPATRTESYLTVAGPFDTDSRKLTINEKENISGMWYEDEFDGMKIDYYFRKYIQRAIKRQEENKNE